MEQKLFLSAQMNEELFSLHAAGSLSFYLTQGRVKIMFAVPVEVTAPSAASSSLIVCDVMRLRGRDERKETGVSL